MEKITSFTIDHLRLLPGLYVSRKDKVGSETVTTFDLRLTRPNLEPVMNTAEVHTIEHLASSIHQLLTTDPNTYCQKASLAHQAVKGFTWDSFASKFLSTLNQVIQGKNSQI